MDKAKVYSRYDKIVAWFDQHRQKYPLMEKKYLELIATHTPKGGAILDLGCGTGKPIAQFFIDKGYYITGIDGSAQMIALCQKRFPDQNWITADMTDLDLPQRFDAIIAWHSFFHLTPRSQRAMFPIFKTHSKLGGLLVFTSGNEYGEVWSNNGGQQLYHASLAANEYQKLLKAASFEVLIHEINDPTCGNATVWVARAG